MSIEETLITKHLDTWTSAIKAKSSPGRGSGKKQEFYGIKKLRELILELAVRGILVPQDPNDEPSSEKVKEIDTKRKLLVRSGKLKKQKPLPAIPVGELPFHLPKQWEWCRLGDIGLIGSSSRVHQKDWTSSGVAFLRAREIITLSKKGKVDNELFITEQLFERLSKDSLIPEVDDLMITGVGSIGVPYIVKKEDRFYFKDASVLIFKNLFQLYPPYLYTVLTSPYWIRRIHEDSMGTTVHTLTISRASIVLFPLPPLAEQHRIVAKVDELMALCDQLEQQQEDSVRMHETLVQSLLGALTAATEYTQFAQAWQRIASHFDTLFTTESSIDQLKQTILQLAVMGKLVEKDPEEGSAHDILKRVKIPEIALEDSPKLPDHWAWVGLGPITTLMNSGWSPACIPEPADANSWGVLKTTAVQTLDYQEIQNKALPRSLQPRPENEVFDGDILFTRAGPMNRVGILCVAHPTRPKLMLSDKIIRFHLIPEVDPDFAALSMSAGFSGQYIEALKSGMAASQVNISQPKLRTVPIPIPPLAEQHRIVAKVDELMALCDRLKSRLQSSQEPQVHLADCLAKAALDNHS